MVLDYIFFGEVGKLILNIYSIICQTGSSAVPQVIPVSEASQPTPEVSIVPSGPSDSIKQGTALVSSLLILTKV